MVIYLSLLVALIGMLVYVLATNPKVTTLGLVSFGAGLLAFLLQVGGMHLGAGIH
jgi:hypothetical protein